MTDRPVPAIGTAYRLEQLLDDAASRCPERDAVRCGQTSLTYRELADAADRVATGLAALGVGIGDRVAVHLPKVR